MDELVQQLQEQLKIITAERNKYHAELTDLRIKQIETDVQDLKTADQEINKRIRPLEDGLIKANTIYALFAGNGLLSFIAIIKVFNP